MDFQLELSKLDRQIQEQTLQKAKLEQKISTLNEERTKLLAELEKEGIKEEDLEQTIANIEMELETAVEEAKGILA
jgi:predicted  nucleic acid-binding Zn-ribbon protein